MPDLAVADKDLVARLLVEKPLYVRVHATLPEYPDFLYPTRLFTQCPQCKIERPFDDHRPRGSGTGLPGERTASGCRYYIYTCAGCGFHLRYWLEVNTEGPWLRKVGQVPPWSTHIEADLERLLKDDADFFRKGLTTLSQGYGLAACAYFRRVVENQVNHIIKLLIETASDDLTQAGTAEELKELLESKVADKKLAIAARHVPPSLVVDGVNPVRLIYERMSEGIHGLSDDECSNIARDLSNALRFVLLETSRHLAGRRAFVATIRGAAAKQSS